MPVFDAVIQELRLDPLLRPMAWVTCPQSALPAPGQYLLALHHESGNQALPVVLFPAEIGGAPGRNGGEACFEGFLAAPPLPATWMPGTHLALRGPLGRSFKVPAAASRLALAALEDSLARLLPLLEQALKQGKDVALFSDAALYPGLLPALPSSVEVNPLKSLPEGLAWADYLAVDLTPARLGQLRSILGLDAHARLPCPAQALVATPMPCGGIADCGACAVPGRQSWKMACRDGPVFDLQELSW